MKCIDREVTYKNAKFHVVVYTSSSHLCEEVLEATSRGVSGVVEFVRKHGGCYVESENPLRIRSGDESTLVEVKPANIIARMFWGMVVEKAKEYCR